MGPCPGGVEMVGGEMDRDPEWGDEGTSCPFPNPGEQLAPWTSCEKLQDEPVTGQEAQMKIRKDHPGSSETYRPWQVSFHQ